MRPGSAWLSSLLRRRQLLASWSQRASALGGSAVGWGSESRLLAALDASAYGHGSRACRDPNGATSATGVAAGSTRRLPGKTRLSGRRSTHPKRSEDPWTPEDLEAPPFTLVELRRAVCSLMNKKVPCPDGLPAEVLKAVARSHPELLLRMYKSCLRAGVFYSRWKKAMRVLMGKGKGPADAQTVPGSSWRSW